MTDVRRTLCAPTAPLPDPPTGPASAPELVSQLNALLNDMTLLQLRALANSFGIEVGRGATHKSLRKSCGDVIKKTSSPQDSEAKHRRIVMERFFGYEFQQKSQLHYRSRDEDADRKPPRARSASPDVDLSVEHFDCPICLESVPSRSTMNMPCCCQEACKVCVVQAIKVQMRDGNQHLRCPHCSDIVSGYIQFMEEVVLLIEPVEMLAWRTAIVMKHVPDCRQCTKCDKILVVDRTSAEFPSVTCKGCSHRFCFDHGDAHTGRLCPPTNADQIKTQNKISAISQPCPCCKVHIERNGGCNHMTCARCSCDWCWKCGKVMAGHLGGHADVNELLKTSVSNAQNCVSALLFLIVRLCLGPNNVFYTSNTCECGRQRTQSVSWEHDNRNVMITDSFRHVLLIRAVILYSSVLQRFNELHRGKVLMTLYLTFAALRLACAAICPIIARIPMNLYCYALEGSICFINMLVSFVKYFLQKHIYDHEISGEDLHGPPHLMDRIGHSFSSVSIGILVGFCVGALSFNLHYFFFDSAKSYFSTRSWLRRSSVRHCPLPTAAGIVVPSLVLLLLLPGQPKHNAWVFKFCAVWLAHQLLVNVFLEAKKDKLRSMENCENLLNFRQIWSTLWGVSAAALKMLMTMGEFEVCFVVCIGLFLVWAVAAAAVCDAGSCGWTCWSRSPALLHFTLFITTVAVAAAIMPM